MTETKEDWRKYFKELKEAHREAQRVEEEHEYELRVIEPSRPAKPVDLSVSHAGIIASLTLCGFWSASQVTVTLQEGQPFKTGPRAGERRPDKNIVNVFTHAAHPDRRIADIWYENGALRSATIGVAHGRTRLVRSMHELESFIDKGEA